MLSAWVARHATSLVGHHPEIAPFAGSWTISSEYRLYHDGFTCGCSSVSSFYPTPCRQRNNVRSKLEAFGHRTMPQTFEIYSSYHILSALTRPQHNPRVISPWEWPALYKGDERQVTVQVHVDGDLVATWTSSGTTDGFESIGLTGAAGTAIDVVGVLAESEWLSIIEVRVGIRKGTLCLVQKKIDSVLVH